MDRLKLMIYMAAFSLSLALYLSIHFGLGPSALITAWLALILGTAAVVGFERRCFTAHRFFLRICVISVTVIAVIHPMLFSMISAETPVFTTLISLTMWPQLLVTLFASRVLASESSIRYAEAWQQSAASSRSVGIQSQSMPAACCLGSFMAIVCYLAAAQSAGTSASPVLTALLSAVFGDTFIHHTIIFLFFIVIAYIGEALIRYYRDLLDLRRLAFEPQAAEAGQPQTVHKTVSRLREKNSALEENARILLVIETAVRKIHARQETPSPDRMEILAGLDNAGRRFIRTIITFLPLLGFLGTVLGITQALSSLPLTFSNVTAEAPEFSRGLASSLSGIAVAFETTLLGLIANIVASLAMAYLEKREDELVSECQLVVHNTLLSNRTVNTNAIA